jgi:lipopolysaccharide transport system ATP-binding protein
MSNRAILVEELGKRYRIGASVVRHAKLRDALLHLAATPARNLARLRRMSAFGEADERDVIWALRDVSFEVAEGEVLGIVGHNGAGKSTLLKILSRITAPTTGRIEMVGRVGSLLEVGTGFHPELTGRDNVYLNGSILGMDKRYIDRRFEEIVEFAGVGRFIDTPVKRYSSGMHVRLAFAVAAHLEPEILIVDEVLAVGDAEFQRRCLGKMSEVSGDGRTVLFVSHNLVAVQGLCDRAIWVNRGRIELDGPTQTVVGEYMKSAAASMSRFTWSADTAGPPQSEHVRVLSACIRPEEGQPGDMIDVHTPFVIEVAFQPLSDTVVVRPRIHVVNQERVTVFKSNPPLPAKSSGWVDHRYLCRVPGDLLNDGQYSLNLRLIRNDDTIAVQMDDLLGFEIADAPDLRGSSFWEWGGVVRPRLDWRLETGVGGDGGGEHAPPAAATPV